MESENKMKQMDSLGTSDVWLNLVDHYTVEHHDWMQGTSARAWPKTGPIHRQSINSKGRTQWWWVMIDECNDGWPMQGEGCNKSMHI